MANEQSQQKEEVQAIEQRFDYVGGHLKFARSAADFDWFHSIDLAQQHELENQVDSDNKTDNDFNGAPYVSKNKECPYKTRRLDYIESKEEPERKG